MCESTNNKIDRIIKELQELKTPEPVPQTPCEEQGYAIGDIFIVEEFAHTFTRGSVIELYQDDDSSCPLFKLLKGSCPFTCADDKAGAYISLFKLRKIAP